MEKIGDSCILLKPFGLLIEQKSAAGLRQELGETSGFLYVLSGVASSGDPAKLNRGRRWACKSAIRIRSVCKATLDIMTPREKGHIIHSSSYEIGLAT